MQGTDTEIIIQGTPGSPGIAFGPVHVVARGFHAPEVYEIKTSQIESEQNRFREALDKTKVELDELRNHIDKLSGDDHGKIFDAHLLILEDKSLIAKVNSAVEDRHQNAEYLSTRSCKHSSRLCAGSTILT